MVSVKAGRKRKKGGAEMGLGRNWTKEEEQFLSDNWGQMSVPGLCKKLNRSKNAIIDGICPECGLSCGNGGYGPLRCRCGWVGKEKNND